MVENKGQSKSSSGVRVVRRKRIASPPTEGIDFGEEVIWKKVKRKDVEKGKEDEIDKSS
jgi:hypothetical protein